MKDRVRGYSLWFMPGGEASKALGALIEKLAFKLGTPRFPPHVTLLGQVGGSEREVIEKTAALASFLKDFQVNLSGLGYDDEYFRCLYLIAGKEPALMEANIKARSLFGRKDDPPFMPHLSLIYGAMTADDKERLISDVIDIKVCSFKVHRISLFSTEGAPGDWHPVEEFPLS